MWSDPSKRPLIVVGVLVVAAIAGVLAWNRTQTSNERHVDELIARAYEFADIEPGENLLYSRQDYPGCDGVAGDDAWAGFKGSTTGTQERGNVNLAAERAAERFEADGWAVRRFLAPRDGGDDRTDDVRFVYARRGDDDVFMNFSTITLDIVASSGPCVPSFEFPPDPPLPAEPVDRFPV